MSQAMVGDGGWWPEGQPCSISEHLLGLMYALGSELGRGLKTHDLLELVVFF